MQRRFPSRLIALSALVVGLGGLIAWQLWLSWRGPDTLTLRGETMGTTYTVRVAHAGGSQILGRAADPGAPVRQAVEQTLRVVNATLSTWDPASELSRLNRKPPGETVPLSPMLRTVLAAALELSAATDGAFDPTVAPLVNLWGFGPADPKGTPSEAAIRDLLGRVGWRNLRLEGDRLTKLGDGVSVDLSGIAKGFGVDEVARTLESLGFADYLVEIGGEIRVRGTSPEGRPWAIGIEQPRPDLPPGERLQAILRLSDGALATSGSYRRFRRAREGLAHHILDPRTGRPTDTGLVSVTVRAADCMTADGIATALMVLGPEAGLAWVEAKPGVEAYFITATPDGQFAGRASSGFPPLEAPEAPR